MSFFKDLKEDIVQSVNELGGSFDEQVEKKEEEKEEITFEQQVQEELDHALEDLTDEAEEDETEDVESEEEEEVSEDNDEIEKIILTDYIEEEEDITEDEESIEEDIEEEEIVESNPIVTSIGSSEGEETLITKGTTIKGGIQSDTSLVIKGSIVGDVDCKGKLTISGKVEGNSSAAEIYVNTARLEGDLTSEGSVKIDVGTVVIGKIMSSSLVIAGSVKGSIDVDGPVIMDSTAVVKGDVSAKSIQINSGAVIDGKCTMSYADVDLDSFFE